MKKKFKTMQRGGREYPVCVVCGHPIWDWPESVFDQRFYGNEAHNECFRFDPGEAKAHIESLARANRIKIVWCERH